MQGVGFRMFVADVAEHLGLRGYVRNLPDGSVYVLGVGARPSLERLLGRLYQGPTMARITEVEHDWSVGEPSGLGSSFEVRP